MISLLLAAYGTVGDIEILFTLLAGVGALFSLFSTYEAYKDYVAIRLARIGNGRRLLAWSSMHSEAGRFIIQVVFTALGVMAMLLPEVPPYVHQTTLQVVFGAMFRWGLITSSAILLYKSILAYVVRNHLRDERQERELSYLEQVRKVEEKNNIIDPLTDPAADDDSTPGYRPG